MFRRLLGVLAVGTLGCASAGAVVAPPAPTPALTTATVEGAAAGAPIPAPPRGPAQLRPFDDVVKGALARSGFLDSYEKDGRLMLAVPNARLGEPFLLTFQIAQGIGARGLFGGTMLNIFEGQMVTFARRGDKLYLLQLPTRFTADPGSPTAHAVDLTFGASVLESTNLLSVREDSALLVDATDWFVSDLSNVGARVRNAVAPRSGQPGRAALDRNRSYLEAVKSFPRNLNVRAKLTFLPAEPVTIASVPDARYVPVSIAYSLAALPETPMTPRAADDRMGYFITARKNFSSTDDSFFARYVNRWRLECAAPPVAGLCTPRQPIVYYVDRTVPEEYRPYMIAGVNAWAAAFEAAGFRNAIRAELLPDSVDPEDLRYPTLRWNTSDQPGYGAIGPSIVDPRTGEILDADILFEASMIQGFRNNWKTTVSPATAVEMLFAAPGEDGLGLNGEAEHFAASFEAQGVLLRTLLATNGDIDPGAAVPSEFVGQAITWVTMHEVGHTLGLRHNFRSSADTPVEKLQDRTFTEEHGVFSSVMEYPSINLAPKGQHGGLFYNKGVGSSDRWVIAYGYTPDAARAAALAREAAFPGHAFGTDEDARGPGALDPTVNTYDLGSDPLTWGRQRAALVASLWPTLPARVLTDDTRYGDATSALQVLLNQYTQAVATSVKYLGGQYQHRDHVGDPRGRAPFVPVPRAKQLEALAFLAEWGFGEQAYAVPPAVLAQLGANRWSHWGEVNTYEGRIDYPLHEQVLGAQRALLEQVTQPLVFARIRDAESKYGVREVLTIPELMHGLTRAAWSEVYGGARRITPARRDLQRVYLDRLGELAIGDVPRLPADARAVARAQLVELRRRVDASRGRAGLDAYARAHLAESSARITKLLDASMEMR